MCKALHSRDDTDKLYVSRKERRGLASIEDGVNEPIQGLEDQIRKNKGRLYTAVNRSIGEISRNRKTTKTRIQKWEEKQLYGYFKQQTSDIAHEKIWTQLRDENLKRETEYLQIAVRNNTKRNNYVKTKIDKTQQYSKWRI